MNKGKRSVAIDFSRDEGQDLIRRLICAPGPDGGLLITNAGGRDWLRDTCLRKVRPDLIVVEIQGRSNGTSAIDYTVNAATGLPFLTGPSDRLAPVNHVLPAWDRLTGLHAPIASWPAERRRRHLGAGSRIRISLEDVALASIDNLGFLAELQVNGRGRVPLGNDVYGTFGCDFATRDGRRVMVVALTEPQWEALVAVTETGDTGQTLQSALSVSFADEAVRFEHRELLRAMFLPWFERRTFDVVCERA